MSIEANMTKDIKDFEPKIFGPFTTRQIACITIGAVVAIPIAIITPVSDIMIRFAIMCVVMAPFVVCGWVKTGGIYIDKFVIQMFKLHVKNPMIRKYRIEGTKTYIRKNESFEKKTVKRSKTIKEYR